MSELVKLEDVKNAFNKLYGNEYSFAELREKLNVYNENSVDFKPVVRGKWKAGTSILHCVCSECLAISSFNYNFCPECGADMRGEAT